MSGEIVGSPNESHKARNFVIALGFLGLVVEVGPRGSQDIARVLGGDTKSEAVGTKYDSSVFDDPSTLGLVPLESPNPSPGFGEQYDDIITPSPDPTPAHASHAPKKATPTSLPSLLPPTPTQEPSPEATTATQPAECSSGETSPSFVIPTPEGTNMPTAPTSADECPVTTESIEPSPNASPASSIPSPGQIQATPSQ